MTTGKRQDGQWTIIEARSVDPRPIDACCSLYPGSLKRNGTMTMRRTDMPHMMRPTKLHYELQKWRCRNAACKANHVEEIYFDNPEREITQRCSSWIFQQCLDLTFTKVAEIVGIHERSVRRIFNDTYEECVDNLNLATPRVLGIDEKHVMRGGRGIFGDVEKRSVLDMLPSCKFRPMDDWVNKLADKDRVEVVTIDMSRNYRDIVTSRLPNATIVVEPAGRNFTCRIGDNSIRGR